MSFNNNCKCFSGAIKLIYVYVIFKYIINAGIMLKITCD